MSTEQPAETGDALTLTRRTVLATPLALLATATVGAAETAKITFLHINDVYEISPREGLGGFAELMTVLRAERAKAPHSILTLGGDLFASSMMSGFTRGEQMVELTNAVGVQVAAVGNHEFDFGPEVFKARVAQSVYPWLAANMVDADGKIFGGCKATTMIEMGGLKIGCFGMLTPSTQRTSKPGTVMRFISGIDAARAAVAQLQAEGADIVVAVTHLGLGEDRAMLRSVPGIHLVLGGHEHELITAEENGVLIQKSGHDAQLLSVVELTVEKTDTPNGKRVSVKPSLRLVPVKGFAPDPEIGAIVRKWETLFELEIQQPVGKITVALDSRREAVRYRECAMGNLITDAMRDGLDADVAILNGGGIRGDKLYEPGAMLMRKDVLAELPFGNIGVLVELSGTALREAVEQGLYAAGRGGGGFPQVSGIAFRYDPNRERGDRVIDIKVGGKPMAASALYRVATNDYLLNGGDGYVAFTKGRTLVDPSDGTQVATLVMDYIAARGTVSPQIEGRIIVGS